MFDEFAQRSFLNYTVCPVDDPILRALEEAVIAAPDAQRRAFFSLIGDRNCCLRAIHRRKVTGAYRPTPEDAPLLESLLITKYDDAREELLRLLALLPEEARQESVARLCASRKEALRSAGEALRARISP